jgi:hypothetical protein
MRVTPTVSAAASVSALRIPASFSPTSARSCVPVEPSVTMQYVTSAPASVHVATVPAQPNSMSSGCAETTSARQLTRHSFLLPRVPCRGQELAQNG